MGNSFSSANGDESSVAIPSSRLPSLQSDRLREAELLRNDARTLQDQAREVAKHSQMEYDLGRRSGAKALSLEKAALYSQMREKNEQAAHLIFKHFNDHRSSNVIDLHGLYVAEALNYLEGKVQACRAAKISQLTVITGVGNHSQDNIAKIKPEVERFARQNQLTMSSFGGHILIDLQADAEQTTASNQRQDTCTLL